jgi:predicted Fe-Mo cluster-binding NifX family protein
MRTADYAVLMRPAGNTRETMKVAIAVKDNFNAVSGHAGKTRTWLVFDCTPDSAIPPPRQIVLRHEQLPHYVKDDGPHPLDGVEIVVAGSCGDGFIRHMNRRGAQVLLTGETDPHQALTKVLAGEALPDTRFDVTTTLCKLRDLFSRH